MSIEIQTAANRLITCDSDAELYAGFQGPDNYVLRKPLELTMADANTLVVGPGNILQNGKHIRLKGATEFTIPSGVQAQRRSNIAVIRTTITRGESDLDTIYNSEGLVLSGEPTLNETPVDPVWIEGNLLDGDVIADIPIARVVTDGINAGEPEPLFNVLASAADMRDYISQIEIVGIDTTNIAVPANGYSSTEFRFEGISCNEYDVLSLSAVYMQGDGGTVVVCGWDWVSDRLRLFLTNFSNLARSVRFSARIAFVRR